MLELLFEMLDVAGSEDGIEGGSGSTQPPQATASTNSGQKKGIERKMQLIARTVDSKFLKTRRSGDSGVGGAIGGGGGVRTNGVHDFLEIPSRVGNDNKRLSTPPTSAAPAAAAAFGAAAAPTAPAATSPPPPPPPQPLPSKKDDGRSRQLEVRKWTDCFKGDAAPHRLKVAVAIGTTAFQVSVPIPFHAWANHRRMWWC